MTWHVWPKRPAPDVGKMGPLHRAVEEFEVQLVHWTPEQECRTINILVRQDGSVQVEQGTADESVVEHVTRYHIPGWEE